MPMRTYTRTYRAEVTETFVFGPADLTDEERQLLDDLEASGTTLIGQADEILCRFDADHEETAHLDDRDLDIARTRWSSPLAERNKTPGTFLPGSCTHPVMAASANDTQILPEIPIPPLSPQVDGV